MDVSNFPKYFNRSNLGSPYMLQPSKLLSPDVNKFFGTGALDSLFNNLLGKVFPKLPMNPSFVRQHGIQDAMELGEMFNNGKMHVDLGNLERGRPIVSNSAFWGMDGAGTRGMENFANTIADKAYPKSPDIPPNMLPPNITSFLKSGGLNEKMLKLAAKKLKNEQKEAKDVKSTVESTKSDEKNKKNNLVAPAVGAAVGAGLPASALAQYWLQDYKKIKKNIKNAPVYSPKNLSTLLRPGDIGTTGYIDFPKRLRDVDNPLHDGSRIMTGSPAGHGVSIGKHKKLYHAGLNGGFMVDLPKKYRDDGVHDRLGNMVSAIEAFHENKSKPLRDKVKIMINRYSDGEKQRRILLNALAKKQHPEKVYKSLDRLPTELKELSSKKEPGYAVFFRNKKVSPSQNNKVIESLERNSMLPYGGKDALLASLKRVFLPKVKGKTTTSCKGTMCGDSIGVANKITGGGYSGRAMPVDTFLHPDYEPVGIASGKRMPPEKVKKLLLQSLNTAGRQRTQVGLGAMGVGAGLGIGAGILTNKVTDKIKDLLFSKAKNES